MPRSTPPRGAPSASELHRRWLQLVETEGPFLAVPALKRVWPQGMPALDPDGRAVLAEARPAFEQAWESWDLHRDDVVTLSDYRTARDRWVATVLRDVVGWQETYVAGSGGPLADLQPAVSPDHRVRVSASAALVHDGRIGALVLVVDPTDALSAVLDDGWAASPLDRAEALLRANDVAVGLVTDGRWWALVCARTGAMAASGAVDALTWVEETGGRDAFLTLLSRQRLVGGRPEDRLPALFAESVAAAEEITEALGVQVRRAVELLVTALSEAAVEARRRGEPDPLPVDRSQVYEAAVTVMMRVVFLLFAEERVLLPQSELFTQGYAMGDRLDELDARAREEGSESLDASHLTWHRLLATSQALYAGASFEDLRLPAYGGSLFDPRRFHFLLGRSERGTLSLAVSDLVLREVLRAVQVAQLKGQPARRISFRDIDVEQIGYIYEGLLGYSCAEVDEVTLGLIGSSGAEPEMSLTEVEALALRHRDPGRFADAVIAWVKAQQPGAKAPTRAALAKAYRDSDLVEDAERALLTVTRDDDLRKRLRPFAGIIRRDLRNRPTVVLPGGLLVVETPSRATAGAHYTPKSLAEEVVEHALEPLVYAPGPHQTADRDAWRRISSDRILDLKVADIACGSGAFLVAAARYLAARLIEAWRDEQVAFGEPQQLYVKAVREVVASCLYGADINGMAVEMCKLSLWLVSLDPHLPFSFVDDKVLHGNSLLGVTDVAQLKALHVDPAAATAKPSLFDLDVDATLVRAISLRQRLASEVDDADPQRSATTKRRIWTEYQQLTAILSTVADGVIAAGLAVGGKAGKALNERYENLALAVADAFPGSGERDRTELDWIIERGLTPTVPTDYLRWKPLHWALSVPDVMLRGGFDAVLGNPPFLGGKKISPALGFNVREWLVNVLANGYKANGDLVAYFLLRAAQLLNPTGTFGLIATNTVAQGDTRQVGLDRLVDQGFTITRSVQSRSWPAASANLEYAAVWGTPGRVGSDAVRVCDDVAVPRISTLLEPIGRVDGDPRQLVENQHTAFIGCIVLGMGFVIDSEQAQAWISEDAVNQEVLLPYLNGSDLNSRPDSSASRWVIDFQERSQQEARSYQQPWRHVLAAVRPDRLRYNARKYPRMVNEWWKFWNGRPGLRRAIADLDEVLVLTRVSKTVMPMRVATGQVFDARLAVFATDSFATQGVLSSSIHWGWAVLHSTTMRLDPSYAPSAAFKTFARPESTDWLDKTGRMLDTERRDIMLRRQLGLTKLYNLVNDPDVSDEADEDVARMRAIHVELDQSVMDAYGWGDVPLDHGLHTYRQMQRWTVSPAARVEILDRLLEENHRRAAAQGDETVLAPLDDDEPSEDLEEAR